MRIATVGLTAVALALMVVSCADGCSAREAANTTTPDPESAPAAAAPTSDPGSATPGSPTENVPQDTVPEGEVPMVEPLPSTKPEPEPRTIDGMKTASANEPPLNEMQVARVVGKLGPPVDVRYQVSGVVAKDQPVTLQLAFVPRLDGRNLRVEFPESAGVSIDSSSQPLASVKASKADVLRHKLLVTPTVADSGQLRAIVSIDVGDARYAGAVSIPLGERPTKTASSKIP
jgi:hypothetical protein